MRRCTLFLLVYLAGCGKTQPDQDWLRFADCVGRAEAFSDITLERDMQQRRAAQEQAWPSMLTFEPVFPGLSSELVALFDHWTSDLPPQWQERLRMQRATTKENVIAAVSYEDYRASDDKVDGYFGRFAAECVPLTQELFELKGATD